MHTESQIGPGRSFFQGGSFFSARPALVAATLIAAALFCFIGVGQSSGSGGARAVPAQDDHTTGTSRAAIEKFWTIYHGNDYAAIQIEVKSGPAAVFSKGAPFLAQDQPLLRQR